MIIKKHLDHNISQSCEKWKRLTKGRPRRAMERVVKDVYTT